MSGLNYFLPSQTAKGHYENPLTRAFLSTLRFSPNLLTAFYQLVRDGLPDEDTRGQLPRTHVLDLSELQIETQRGSLGTEVEVYVSVLITNDPPVMPETISSSDRKAVYDGVITFGQRIKLFVENKPQKDHVWHGQLNPRAADVPEEALLLGKASVVSWRDLVEAINQLVSYPSISGGERQALVDLREFMHLHHPNLNPYKSLDQCGDSRELIELRIESLLKAIAANDALVKYHQGWAYYIEAEGHAGIERIGLILENPGKPEWYLKLFIGYADTVKQSQAFYKRNLDLSAFERFEEQGLMPHGNFHFSFMQRHLVWYRTTQEQVRSYVDYWHDRTDEIGQYKVGAIKVALQRWFKAKVLNDDADKAAELDKSVFQTGRTTVNVAPGFVLTRTWNKETALRLDKTDALANEIRKAIVDGLGIMREDPKFLK
ncbi:MAG: hypothetical protein JST38_04445 [Bacteroidetes bacterium]|nr:hypothetical protein [Bacteroidota bacterium]